MYEYEGAAAIAARHRRRFEQAQRIREALTVDIAATARLDTAGTMQPCPHCGAPMIQKPEAVKPVAVRRLLLKDAAEAVRGCKAAVWELIDAVLATEHDGRGETLARALGYCASSLNSRFTRAGLPSPSQMMRATMLLRFWEVMRSGQAASLTKGADAVGYSSPQALHRTALFWTKMTARDFVAMPPENVLRWASGLLALDKPETWKRLKLPPKSGAARVLVVKQ